VIKRDGSNPYGQFLSIGLTLDSTSDGFNCEEVVEAITAAMVILAPELVEADALEGVELTALCGIIDNPQSAISNFLAPSAKMARVQGHAKRTALSVTSPTNSLISKTSTVPKATASYTAEP
jgi:hypothetical protein